MTDGASYHSANVRKRRKEEERKKKYTKQDGKNDINK